jgi:hypothetical protein
MITDVDRLEVVILGVLLLVVLWIAVQIEKGLRK